MYKICNKLTVQLTYVLDKLWRALRCMRGWKTKRSSKHMHSTTFTSDGPNEHQTHCINTCQTRDAWNAVSKRERKKGEAFQTYTIEGHFRKLLDI